MTSLAPSAKTVLAVATVALLHGGTVNAADISFAVNFEVKEKTLIAAINDIPRLSVGDRLVVSVMPESAASDEWFFKLGSLSLPREKNTNRYTAIVNALGRYPLTLEAGSTGVLLADEYNFTVTKEASIGQMTGASRKPLKDKKGVNLYFFETGLPDKLPAGITDNEPLSVYLALPEGELETEYAVQISGNVRGEDVNILGQGSLEDFSDQIDLGRLQSTGGQILERRFVYWGTYGPFSAPQVTITITKQNAQGQSVMQRTHVLRVRRTFIASLRVGGGLSKLRFNEFVLRTSEGTQTIQNRQGHSDEIRPFLLAVFYGWQFWKRDFWNGRDLEERPSIVDRLNPVIGAGLQDLGSEFVVGGSLEVARGLDVVWGHQFAKLEELDGGIEVGQVFEGSLQDLPVRERWKGRSMFGASVDIRVVTGILSGLFSEAGGS